ncbi:MAG: hypothetical protein OHK0024_35660 [Thalassobaculales bacterium]
MIASVEDLRLKVSARAPGIRGAARGDHDLNPGMAPPENPRRAAVLVPIVQRAAEPTIILTRRTDHLAHHPGQISFPGGRIEPEDPTPEAAALRETQEEIGLGPDNVEVLGRLDTYETRTGFTITPVVGLVRPTFSLSLDPVEVAEAFEVPLSFVLDPANHQRHSRTWQGMARSFWVLPYLNYYIWGATAGMLVNLSEVLRSRP